MHTIHNIAFEIDVNHTRQDISWEQYYVDFLQDQLLPKVERLCNHWDAKYPNTKCSIEEIDIEVEVDSLDKEELQKKIITKISDQLTNIDRSGKTSQGSVRATITSLASPFEALISYLKEGILPAYISVKNFKEWLGSIIQFTPTEKVALTALFSTHTEAVERMLSILQNDYEKFAEIIGTTQKIKKQYIQLEEQFFKKFLKAICEKIQISYQEKQAEIWFKTLGLSSSLAQFSKTFLQLLQPKAVQEKKRLQNINEHQFSIVLLQTIVQNDSQKPIKISISKVFDVVSITKDEVPDSDAKEISKNTQINNSSSASTSDTSATSADKQHKDHKAELTNDTFIANREMTNVNKDNNASAESTKKGSITNGEQHKTTEKKTDKAEQDEHTELGNTTINKSLKNESTQERNVPTKSNADTSSISEKIDQESSEDIHKSAQQSATLANNDKEEVSKKEGEAQAISKEYNANVHTTNSKDETTNFVDNQNKQQNNTVNNTNKQDASSKHIDQAIFEKLARNNKPVREIPLTTEKAGLILLNPFLVRFFTGAQLINEENQIADFGKACTLLHFIATGTEEVTDVELTLEKICLGIPLDTIINYQTPLTEVDKALCEELLQAVIQNWSVLKNSTPNTLRDMFIKREGKITLKKDSIKLEIERYAQDILLDRIPWNISLFKLKWMDKMMHIEW